MPKLNKLSLILIILFSSCFVLFTFIYTKQAGAFSFWGSVLGDDDKSEDEDKKGKDEDKEGEDKEDEDKKGENKEDEAEQDEDKNDDEDKQAEKKEERTTVVNKDNTRTVTKRKVEDNGKVEIESKTYDVGGRVIEEFKSKEEGDKKEAEYKAKQFAENGGKISEMKFKSKEGDELKLMIKNEDKSLTKVRYDDEHNYVRIVGKPKEVLDDDGIENEENEVSDDDSEDVLVRNGEDGSYEVEHHGIKAHIDFPITINDEDGSIAVLTPNGEKTLRKLPGNVIEKAQEIGRASCRERV